MEKIFPADDVRKAAVSKNPIHVFGKPAQKEVALLVAKGLEQILQRKNAGGVHVTGILKPKNEDAHQRIGAGGGDSGKKQICCAKEKIAFHMDDGDGGMPPAGGAGRLRKVSVPIELILDE